MEVPDLVKYLDIHYKLDIEWWLEAVILKPDDCSAKQNLLSNFALPTVLANSNT